MEQGVAKLVHTFERLPEFKQEEILRAAGLPSRAELKDRCEVLASLGSDTLESASPESAIRIAGALEIVSKIAAAVQERTVAEPDDFEVLEAPQLSLLERSFYRPTTDQVDKYLRLTVRFQASDLHLQVGRLPSVRVKGDLKELVPDRPLTPEQMEALCMPLLTKRHLSDLRDSGGADLSHEVDKVRFRVHICKERGNLMLVARRVNTEIPSFAELGLPPQIQRLTQFNAGLVILAGPTGSGKSTTIAAMIDDINQKRECQICTLEDPIEYAHVHKRASVCQREIGSDCKDFQTGLRQVVREDPDVILIGEMRDKETIVAALQAAETGHLVFGTVHARTAPGTIGRIIDLCCFSADGKNDESAGIRLLLAQNLKAIVAQQLVKGLDVARVPVCEIMLNNPTIAQLIVKGEDPKLAQAMRQFADEGMVDFNTTLCNLVLEGHVHKQIALAASDNAEQLKAMMRGIKMPEKGFLGG